MAVVRIPVIVGPTGIGKTALALQLAERWPLEIVSADSRQVYRRLDIGTAKPSRRERRRVIHHGIDVVDPGTRYNAARFATDAKGWIEEVVSRGKLPVVVGGTGLYIKALVDGLFLEPPLDPTRRGDLARWLEDLGTTSLVRWASRLDPQYRGGGRQRASRAIEVAVLTGKPLSYWQAQAKSESVIEPWYLVMTAPRPVIHRRIAVRASEMVRRGMIEEVAAVIADGADPMGPGLDAIGIREAVEYLLGRRGRETVVDAITISSRQYAKRQETWFRHQLKGPVMTIDASGPIEELAQVVDAAWARESATRDIA